MTRKNYKRRIGSGFQQFSQRLLMAGDVGVSVSSNDLFITGDSAHNRVDISTVNGMLRVTGTNWNGNTTINGANQIFEVNANSIDDIWIDMNGGNDRVFVNGVHLNNTSHGRLDIKTDDGNDLVGVYNSSAQDIVIDTGNHDDDVITSYSAVTRDMVFNLGSGNDELDLYGVYAADDIHIDAGSGNDDVAIQAATVVDDIDANLGDGNDILWFNGGKFGDLNIDADSGNDRATLQGVVVTDDLDVEMDSGDDQLYIYNSTVADSISLRGGLGTDKLVASGNNFNAFAFDSSF